MFCVLCRYVIFGSIFWVAHKKFLLLCPLNLREWVLGRVLKKVKKDLLRGRERKSKA